MKKLNITDLSIGDWVNIDGEPRKINSINGISGIVSFNGLGNYHGTGVIEPIPITTEFLEKNGCEQLKDWNNPTRLSYAAEDYYVTGWMGKESWNCGVHNDNIDELVIIAKAKYVHELQHALRLAGNTREIDL